MEQYDTLFDLYRKSHKDVKFIRSNAIKRSFSVLYGRFLEASMILVVDPYTGSFKSQSVYVNSSRTKETTIVHTFRLSTGALIREGKPKVKVAEITRKGYKKF